MKYYKLESPKMSCVHDWMRTSQVYRTSFFEQKIRLGETPDVIPKILLYDMLADRQFTDFLRTERDSYLVTPKVREILESECKLGRLKFYEAEVYKRKCRIPHKYYLLAGYDYLKDIVDYENMIFKSLLGISIKSFSTITLLIKGIKNREMYYEVFGKLCEFYTPAITFRLKENAKIDTDIYYSDFRINRVIANENFRDVVEKNKLTGLVFEELNTNISWPDLFKQKILTCDEYKQIKEYKRVKL